MLIRLEKLGWVKQFRNNVLEGKKPQLNALALATENADIQGSAWVLTMDVDEFGSSKCGDGMISDVMDRFPKQADALAITGWFFGSSGVTDRTPGRVTETDTMAAPYKFRKHAI